MRRSVLRLLLPAVLLAGLAMPATVSAFPLSTCTLSLTSLDESGATISTAQSGAPDATQANPFLVEWEGSVAYTGSTTVVIKNYTYQVSVFGVPTPIRGSDSNDDENTTGADSVGVGVNSPFGRVAGLYFVSGTYQGEGGSCAGSGWFRLLGDPVGTLPWILGLVLVILGALGLYGGTRGNTITSVVGGFVLGTGLAILAISYAVLPVAEQTPLLLIAGMTVVGIVIGFLGRRGRGRGEPTVAEPA